ncbi:MAG: DNA-binding protein WhiA [Bacilli bacterium]|nr:DNA-binding protein WhiA [Bacilli bacterium]
MSFTTEIKNEISKIDNTRSESIAELSAFIRINAEIKKDSFKISTENAAVARRIFKLIKEIYDINSIVMVRKVNLNNRNVYMLEIKQKVDLILKDLSILNDENDIDYNPKSYIISDDEEKRAYLRGCFLACGSINDPKTARYHLEFLIGNKKHAELLKGLLNEKNLNSKIHKRPRGYMVYIKEAEKIGDFLRIIDASSAVLYYEDIRIYRDHKNMTNRLNNCEQANIDKIIGTAHRQVEDINIISRVMGLDLLDEKLQEAARYRIKYSESSLSELSELIYEKEGRKITKSGLNHRFRKLKEIADMIRDKDLS